MAKPFDKKSIAALIHKENEHILDVLLTFNVPESVEDIQYNDYLLDSKKNSKQPSKNTAAAPTFDELQERLVTLRNKIKTKKRPATERALKKRENKKLKKNKEFKKVLISAAKASKNEAQKQTQLKTEKEDKKNIKPQVPQPVFNEEAKIVFSKIDFTPRIGAKAKQSHQNPREILKKIKSTDKKIKELKEQGETDKAHEMKNEIAWKKAFDRVEGKKVKDDPKLLYKALKKRKVEKKKSKKQWVERKQKVESGIEQRQKKRQENIDQRIKKVKNKKLKKLSKKGKIIPGF